MGAVDKFKSSSQCTIDLHREDIAHSYGLLEGMEPKVSGHLLVRDVGTRHIDSRGPVSFHETILVLVLRGRREDARFLLVYPIGDLTREEFGIKVRLERLSYPPSLRAKLLQCRQQRFMGA